MGEGYTKEEVSYLKYKYKDFKIFWKEALKTQSRVKWSEIRANKNDIARPLVSRESRSFLVYFSPNYNFVIF